MYYGNQIIYDLDKKKPVQLSNPHTSFAWNTSQYPKRHTHLVYKKTGRIYVNEGGIGHCRTLLKRGELIPGRE